MTNVRSLEEGEELMTELFLKACAVEIIPIYEKEIKDYNVCRGCEDGQPNQLAHECCSEFQYDIDLMNKRRLDAGVAILQSRMEKILHRMKIFYWTNYEDRNITFSEFLLFFCGIGMKNPLNRLVVDDEWKSKLQKLVTEHQKNQSGDWKKKILKIMEERDDDK